MDSRRAGRAAGARRDCRTGAFEIAEEQDSGVVYHVGDRDHRRRVRRRPPRQPRSGPGAEQRSRATSAIVSAQMVFMNVIRSHSVGQRGPLPAAQAADAPGLGVRSGAAGRVRRPTTRSGSASTTCCWRCLAPHLGDRLPAGSFASICGTFIGGPHPDTGQHFTIVEPQVGGWGASARRDGNSAMFSGFHGDTFNCPAEVAEARYGLYVDRLALERRARRRGRAPRRQGDRRRVPRRARTAASSPAPTRATSTSRGRLRAGARARRTTSR